MVALGASVVVEAHRVCSVAAVNGEVLGLHMCPADGSALVRIRKGNRVTAIILSPEACAFLLSSCAEMCDKLGVREADL